MDDKIKRAKKELKSLIGRPPWLMGVGIGKDNDGHFIKVNVSDSLSAEGLPSEVLGVRIKVDVVGDIVASSELGVIVDEFAKLAKKKPKWKKLPKGWKQKSVKKYWKSLTEDSEHPFTECVKEMKDKMKKPEGFCAKTKDVAKGTTEWRGKERKKNKKRKS